MLIETSIKPRREKTVRLTTPRGATIVFEDDGTGHLVADVTDSADLSFVLSRSEFSPLDEADFGQAESMMRKEADPEDLGPDDLSDDSGDENAAPVEVLTPPKPGKPGKAAK